MSNPVVFSSEDDFKRMVAAVLGQERDRRSLGSPGTTTYGAASHNSAYVKITDPFDANAKGWPGVLTFRNLLSNSGGSSDWLIDRPVYAEEINGQDLEVDKRYECKVYGLKTWDEPVEGEVQSMFVLVDTAAVGQPGLLVEVTGYDAGTRYHTVKRKTWTGSPGDVADYSPLTTYTQCRASARTLSAFVSSSTPTFQIPTGTLCYLTAIPDVADEYWIEPTGNYATPTTPGIVSTYAQGVSGFKVFNTGLGTVSASWALGGFIFSGQCSGTQSPFATTDPSLAVAHFGGGANHSEGFTRNGIPSINARGAIVGNYVQASSGVGYPIQLSGEFERWYKLSTATGGFVPLYASGLLLSNVGTNTGPVTFISAGANGGRDVLIGNVRATSWNGSGEPTSSTLEWNLLSVVGQSAIDRVGGQGGYAICDDGGATHHIGRWGLLAGGIFKGGILVGGAISTGPIEALAGPTTLTPGVTYYADSTSGRSEFYLPLTAVAGDKFRVIGRASAGWQINQRAGQTIRTANGATTTGTTGYLRGEQWMSVEIECLTDGLDFVIASGNTEVADGPITTLLVWN